MAQGPLLFVGEREVLATGAVVVAPGEKFEIAPDAAGRVPVRIRVSFESVEGGKPRMDANLVDGVVALRLFNINNPNGTTPLKPLAIATIDDRTLFLSYLIHSVGSGETATRLFNFTVSRSAPASEAPAS